jgi:hypothetical protein
LDKSLSLNEIRSRCAQFVIDWRDSDGAEKQEAEGFVRDLLTAFGISRTKAALYQKKVQKASTGNDGYIDALVPGVLLFEMKTKGKSLALAEQQALDYIHNLSDAESPRYVLTCDFQKFRLLDLESPKSDDVTEFELEQLPLRAELLGFLAGYHVRSFGDFEQQEASIRAAKIMGNLYETLELSGYSEHDSSIFLVRTLFALYADDSGMWQRGTFAEFIANRTSKDGSDLGAQLSMLFQVLNQPLEKRFSNLDELLQRFPYVNGGVFSEPLSIPSFDSRMRDQLLSACEFDWSSISPSIFGSLFQAVKSAEARRALGEHYTTETNIRKAIDPLFLDDLEQRFEKAKNEPSELRKLRKHLAEIKIFDPACGCGNFLVVTYKELRNLELKILLRLQELGAKGELPTLFFRRQDLAVQLENIYGIELEEWPARIAQTALLLTEHQANRKMELALGHAPSVLPLETIQGIKIGNALRENWQKLVEPSPNVYIMGNPPFIGHQTKKSNQVQDLKEAWGPLYNGYLDYVTGWFKKSIDYFAGVGGGRFAFVSTNSISQGQPVEALFKPIFESGWRIRFAHQTFPWTSEAPGAAAVHCVIVGFDKDESPDPALFVYPTLKSQPVYVRASHINGHLQDAEEFYVPKRSEPLSLDLPNVNFGTMPIDDGNLIVEASEISLFLQDPIAKKYIRPFIGAKELIQNRERFCLWLEELSSADLRASDLLRSRIEGCKAFRYASPKGGDAYKYRDTPHLFRPNKKRPKVPYVCLPRVVSTNRLFFTVSFLESEVIASDAVFTAEDPDGFAFAIASSSMFITWLRLVGGKLKSDLRFSNTVVWNNFPLPKIDEQSRLDIANAGKAILEYRREHPNRSLADLYDPMVADPKLLSIHTRLDRAVDKAFGHDSPLASNSDREILLKRAFLELTAGT